MEYFNPIGKNKLNWLFGAMLLAAVQLNGQSRVFLTVGGTYSLGGNFTTVLASTPAYLSADLEVDKKVFGSLHLLTGITTFGVGYSSANESFGSLNSTFNARYVGIPLMARWNAGNRNSIYVDMGFVTYYLAYAHLTESISKFGTIREYDGNIAPYSNRLYEGFKIQFTFAFNRFIVSEYFMFQFKGQETISNLADHWGLNAQQSTYLISNGYSDFFLGGFKIGCRIK